VRAEIAALSVEMHASLRHQTVWTVATLGTTTAFLAALVRFGCKPTGGL
jgi:hypothetical protein